MKYLIVKEYADKRMYQSIRAGAKGRSYYGLMMEFDQKEDRIERQVDLVTFITNEMMLTGRTYTDDRG